MSNHKLYVCIWTYPFSLSIAKPYLPYTRRRLLTSLLQSYRRGGSCPPHSNYIGTTPQWCFFFLIMAGSFNFQTEVNRTGTWASWHPGAGQWIHSGRSKPGDARKTFCRASILARLGALPPRRARDEQRSKYLKFSWAVFVQWTEAFQIRANSVGTGIEQCLYSGQKHLNSGK